MVNESVYNWAWVIPAAPFFAFLVIVFGMMRTKLARNAPWVSILAIFVSALVSLSLLIVRMSHPEQGAVTLQFNWLVAGPLDIQGGVLIDNLSALMCVVVTWIATAIQIYSTVYMEHELASDYARFFSYMSIFAAGMLVLVLAPNFVQIYVGWELVGVCSYLLIGFWYFKQSAADANKKAFVVTRLGDMGFLLGILMLYAWTGHLNFIGTPDNPSPLTLVYQGVQHGTFPTTIATLIAILVFCGAIGKSAQFPLHIWLPDAMEGPTPVSALIHAATMVAAGVYMVARCLPLFMATHAAMLFVAYIGAFTSFLAATMGLTAFDIKRVLAYSTCSQLGYMICALGVGGMTAGTFHLVTHAFFKALLFLCAGSVIHGMHTNDMWFMGGLRKTMPVTAFTFLGACLAISGIFPFSGFWSKDEIVGFVLHNPNHLPGLGLAQAFIVMVAIMTAAYMFRLYFVTFEGEYRGPQPVHPITGEPEHSVVHDHANEEHESHSHTEQSPVHEADPAANYWEHEAHRPAHIPGENPWMMVGPLVFLCIFAVINGWITFPAVNGPFSVGPNMSEFIAPHVQFAALGGEAFKTEGAESFLPSQNPLVLVSLLLAITGIAIAGFLYWPAMGADPVVSERNLRANYRGIYRILDNKWYMDDLWRGLATWLMFDLAGVAAWVDANIVDGAVAQIGRGVWQAGQNLREEQTGLVQQYATIIAVAVFLLALGLGLLGNQDMFHVHSLLMHLLGRPV
ncbi:MAG: NADH-quinone oxidoreductase subunit L [Candidatus Xenobia bacterium]